MAGATAVEPTNVSHVFRWLVDQWHKETAATSSGSALIQHPAYQAIICLGMPVLPLILNELRREPDHWFDALTAITGEDPTSLEDIGDIEKMSAAWLKFAAEKGYTSGD